MKAVYSQGPNVFVKDAYLTSPFNLIDIQINFNFNFNFFFERLEKEGTKILSIVIVELVMRKLQKPPEV